MPLSTVTPPPDPPQTAAKLDSLRLLRLPEEQVHPRRPARAVRIAAAVTALAVALLAGVWVALTARSGTADVTVFRVTADRGDASPGAGLTGTGYVITRREYVEVGATVPGRVTWLGAEEGDRVAAGAVLARLDDLALSAARQEAVAVRATAAARLADLRAGTRPEEIEEGRALLAEAEAALRLASVTMQRAERLSEQRVIAPHDVDVARTGVELAVSRRDAAAQRFAILELGPRAESIAIAEADVARAEAAVQQAVARLAETVIRAPFDAVVMEKLREQGDFVVPGGLDRRGSGSALFRIASTTDPRIEVEISETSIAQLVPGQQASIVLDAAPGRAYRGALTKIFPSANRQKATVKVELDVLDADAAMKPEMTAKVTFEGMPVARDTASPSLRIPSSAIVDAGSGPSVFVVRAGVARLAPVDGIREGDVIVTSDPHALSDGQQVQVNQ